MNDLVQLIKQKKFRKAELMLLENLRNSPTDVFICLRNWPMFYGIDVKMRKQ